MTGVNARATRTSVLDVSGPPGREHAMGAIRRFLASDRGLLLAVILLGLVWVAGFLWF
jgi:hypothetical protein